ncbi:TetR/AcrR family transcriptional regulator [Novosphingobium piscinae]|uniref:TetR/AcrR family transcriptional regulator n=1 Tax=Novosphingobium piscinae TaxID=1507448 RepID=A0A7X1KNY8_9SPHN|nr:TetR/AcrR family transcriptional regulator [Novosphingobium piscinae]MBC2667845.1 TetR/AcrR family transcriptional regulator [Novosphingobium piscinae]
MPSRSPKSSTLGRPANPEARAMRREQILRGARACFRRKGFHAASTAEISAEAGVSVANLYQYFPTKDHLIKALIEEDLTSDLDLVGMVEAAGSFRRGLEMTTQLVLADPAMTDDGLLRLEVLAEASRNPEIAAVVREADDHLVAALGALIVRYQNSGEIHPEINAADAARLIVSLYDGLIGRLAFGAAAETELVAAADSFIVRALAAVRAVPDPDM